MRRSDEIARFVVQGEGAFVGQKFVLGLHAAESEHAGKFKLAHYVAIVLAQFLSLQFKAHSSDIFCSLANHGFYLVNFLLSEHCHDRCCLDQASKHCKTTYKVSFGS